MWEFHAVAFAGPGGAEMYAYDVDGDGDNDVITSLAAASSDLPGSSNSGKETGSNSFPHHPGARAE